MEDDVPNEDEDDRVRADEDDELLNDKLIGSTLEEERDSDEAKDVVVDGNELVEEVEWAPADELELDNLIGIIDCKSQRAICIGEDTLVVASR